jgi:hypothetical protein
MGITKGAPLDAPQTVHSLARKFLFRLVTNKTTSHITVCLFLYLLEHYQLHRLYSICTLHQIRMIKSRRMRWVRHAACMTVMRNAYKILVGKPEGKSLYCSVMLWFNQIISYYRSVYTTTLYREIITLCHIISLCYTDDMFRTGNVHLQGAGLSAIKLPAEEHVTCNLNTSYTHAH